MKWEIEKIDFFFLMQFIVINNGLLHIPGGAAITCKNELEKINEENLETVSSQLRQTMIEGSCSGKILCMDWSKRLGSQEISCNADDFGDKQFVKSSKFVIVHGAGQ